ncbi:DUF1127 domain-containing protein [Chelativorans salis]|uniref:DUF1127 domain-containing protein n=1 Tax=Chelativorans salis TaxID=2978478 RepID=A0ABT2LI20_9HYPH|nr:DUF1127 domain-containing protein [Chelativorans sp. EGI FJ00035]MCT7374012.1 DUF1127 domain-containing protein [Chelativorans sp. EGI FJ00035]
MSFSLSGLGSLRLWCALLALPRQWCDRVRERRRLSDLTDRLLDDIGLTRADVEREAARPFWQSLKPGTDRASSFTAGE